MQDHEKIPYGTVMYEDNGFGIVAGHWGFFISHLVHNDEDKGACVSYDMQNKPVQDHPCATCKEVYPKKLLAIIDLLNLAGANRYATS